MWCSETDLQSITASRQKSHKVYEQDPTLTERFRRRLAESARYNQITQNTAIARDTPIITPVEKFPSEAMQPNVSMSLPEVKELRGKDGDSHSIMDYIARIEKNADYEYPDGNKQGKQESQISTFRTYLCSDAKNYWDMLSRDEKVSWDKVKVAYIKKFETEKDQRLSSVRNRVLAHNSRPTPPHQLFWGPAIKPIG